MSEKDHIIIGTAGHIDHGKSSLVKALTGIDPDVLPEEKERGLTIELGFVFLDLPDYEKQIVFIDVPGHEKLVKTMVAGASHINAALLVIAADEGISVQTREHFDILRLLSIPAGLIALTKSDLVDSARLEELKQEVRNYVHGSFLEAAPITPVSSVTREGLDDLRAALMDTGRKVHQPEDSGIFRLPIDRVFTLHGFGTVVAGTILSGEVRIGDRVEIFPDKIVTKVRGLQVHKERRESSGIGNRTALNLQDIDKDALRRGQCVAGIGSLSPTQRIDARLRLLQQVPKELKTRDRVRLHIGTDEIIARVILLEADKIMPGDSALAQFVLESPTVALPQDRFIVRTFSPLFTIGGGEILDTSPPRHKRFDARALQGLKKLEGPPEDVVEQTMMKASSHSRTADELALSLGKNILIIRQALQSLVAAGKLKKFGRDKEERFLHTETWSRLTHTAINLVRQYFGKNPHRQSMPLADLQSHLRKEADDLTIKLILDGLIGQNLLFQREGVIQLPEHVARLQPREQELAGRIEAIYRRAGYETPLEEDIGRELQLNPYFLRKIMGTLLQEGKLIRLNNKVIYHRDALEKARQIVLDHLHEKRTITIAELKDQIHSSRKYACALLEYFDATGLTQRSGDAHMLK